ETTGCGVADQDVQPSHAMANEIHHCRHVVGLADVRLDHPDSAPHRDDATGDLQRRSAAGDVIDNNVRPRLGQAQRRGPAYSARTPSYQRNPSGQIDHAKSSLEVFLLIVAAYAFYA